MFADKLSAQAKAICAAILTLLAQLGVVVGQGGLAQIQALTLGQWIQFVLQTATLYGVTYMVPNYTKPVVVSPADPQV
jgi:hypothetical protein